MLLLIAKLFLRYTFIAVMILVVLIVLFTVLGLTFRSMRQTQNNTDDFRTYRSKDDKITHHCPFCGASVEPTIHSCKQCGSRY